MARFTDLKNRNICTVLNVGDSGKGKTHAFGQLANAGYRVHIFDFDNGMQALGKVLTSEGANRLFFQTFKDGLAKPQAWKNFRKALREDWIEGDENFGSPYNWDENVVLGIDTMTGAFDALQGYILDLSGQKPTSQLSQPQWGTLNREINNMIVQLTSGVFNCNVLINAHWQTVDDDTGVSTNYAGIGSKANSVSNGQRNFDNVIWSTKRKREFVYDTKGDATHGCKLSREMPEYVPADMAAVFATLSG